MFFAEGFFLFEQIAKIVVDFPVDFDIHIDRDVNRFDFDLLRLKLQLNGRPANPLPFIYDTQAGGFVPAGPDSKGSRFEEIKLDVNFSLPLNRLLEYKDLLKLFS